MSKPRRNRKEIVQAIYDVMPAKKYATVDELAKKADVDWKTCQAYLEDLEFELGLNGERYSWLETVTLGSFKGYRRKPRRGTG